MIQILKNMLNTKNDARTNTGARIQGVETGLNERRARLDPARDPV
jgi:hypothetical protein